MPTNILVPELGESVVEATVSRWAKHEGDPVSVGETVVSLETEKVDLEVGAPQPGVLGRIEKPEGSNVKPGDVLGVIEEARAAHAKPAPEAAPAERERRPAPAAAPERAPAEAPPEPQPTPEAPPAERADAAPARATPAARRAAREHAVDLGEVTGTGEAGRIRREDVQEFARRAVPAPEAPAAPTPAEAAAKAEAEPRPVPESEAPPVAPAPTRFEERVRMSRRRQTIARRLVEAQRTSAMLTTFNEVDMTAVMELRRRHKDEFKARYGVGLGIVSFFVKASIAALRAFPRLNAEIQGDEMVIKHYYDIGVAVGAPEGLVVPVLRGADRMSFGAMESTIKEFARKAEERTLTLDDLRGGTFTITNGGVVGSLLSTPILNPPQVGILGLHKIEDRAVPMNGQIVVRPMMYVALSYDHRIVDGMEAVQFLVKVKSFVEDPGSLLLTIAPLRGGQAVLLRSSA